MLGVSAGGPGPALLLDLHFPGEAGHYRNPEAVEPPPHPDETDLAADVRPPGLRTPQVPRAPCPPSYRSLHRREPGARTCHPGGVGENPRQADPGRESHLPRKIPLERTASLLQGLAALGGLRKGVESDQGGEPRKAVGLRNGLPAFCHHARMVRQTGILQANQNGESGLGFPDSDRRGAREVGAADRTAGKAPRGWSRPALVKCPFPPEMGLESSSLAGRPLPLKVKQKRV